MAKKTKINTRIMSVEEKIKEADKAKKNLKKAKAQEGSIKRLPQGYSYEWEKIKKSNEIKKNSRRKSK
jgi:predicted O-methyltransferase YrrM